MDKYDPAFPQPTPYWDEEKKERVFFPGMSLRDWFAGQALPGLIGRVNLGHLDTEMLSAVGVSAYKVADAMLRARERADG